MSVVPAALAIGFPLSGRPERISSGAARSPAPSVCIYLYANVEPVMFRDPSGHEGLAELAFVVADIGTLAGLSVPTIASVGAGPFIVDGTQYFTEAPFGAAGRAILAKAIAIAQIMVRNTITDINAVYQSATASGPYQTYFGDYDTYRAAMVKDNFDLINSHMRSGKLTFRSLTKQSPDFNNKAGVVAWTRRSEINRVNLQPPWWQRSPEDQAETIVHELSHLAADTDDYGYGINTITHWAQRVPMSAVRNAESYGLYAQSFYP